MRDIALGSTIYERFTTRAFATGIPTTLAGTPVISVYEENNLTQITAGVTLTTDYDSVTGFNSVAIVATSGNGYEVGKSYDLVITTGTVGGVSVVGEVVGSFTVESTWNEVDVIKWLGTAAVTPTTAGVPEVDATFFAGTVYATALAAEIDAVWDEVLTGGTHNVVNSAGRRLRQIQEAGGYSGGQIYIDTVNGTAGTTDFENGVETFPVSNIADANTLATSLGISTFHIAPGSSITLAAAQNNQVFRGHNWALALGGQDIAGSHFFGSNSVTGTGVGVTSADFHDCNIATCTLNQIHFHNCGLSGTLTFGIAGTYIIADSHSGIAGSSAPIIDTGAAIMNVNLAIPGYKNGVEIRNLNAAGTDLFSISGIGQIIYAASSSGAVNQRGDWKVTNTGGVTITSDDNTSNVSDILVDTGTTLPTTLGTPIDTDLATDIANIQTDVTSIGITKNAAFSNLEFLMVDATDHVTPETGLTVTGQRSIDGAAFVAVSGAIAEVSNGIYQIDLLAADTNGDVISYRFSSVGAADTFVTITTRA